MQVHQAQLCRVQVHVHLGTGTESLLWSGARLNQREHGRLGWHCGAAGGCWCRGLDAGPGTYCLI